MSSFYLGFESAPFHKHPSVWWIGDTQYLRGYFYATHGDMCPFRRFALCMN